MSDKVELAEDAKNALTVSGFTIGPKIGKGATAQVFKAEANHRQYAIKCIDTENLSDSRKKYLRREIEITRNVSHENIIKFHCLIKYEQIYLFIVSDLAQTDLVSILESHRVLTENEKKQWYTQVVTAVAYIHSIGIAHRDLKPDNVLIHNGIAKLTDFGFAIKAIDSNGEEIECDSFCGTREYQAVEVLNRKKYNPFKSDCFSLGVMLYTFISYKFPFGSGPQLKSGKGLKKLRDNIIKENWELPEDYEDDEALNDLLEKLLTPNLNTRLRSHQILSHTWLA